MEEGKIDSNEIMDNNDHMDQDPSPSSVNEVKLPEIGMTFLSEEEVRTFYNSYAQNVGFGICKLGGRNGDDGKQKYFSIGCAKNGRKVSQAKNILYPRPSTKTNCKAKINVVIHNDGNFVITSYDSALKKKIENEKHMDFVSFNSIMPVVLGHLIERQFQNAYTNNLFKLFQDEIRGLMFCNASLLKEEGTTLVFEVVETMLGKNGEPVREVSFRVHYTELHCQLKCVCRLFEFRGILCRHVINVLIRMKVIEVLMNYIMDRWRKDIKRGYQSISNIYDDYGCDGERYRYNILTPLIQEVQQLGAKNDNSCSILVEMLKDTKEKLIAIDLEHSRVEQLKEVSTSGAKVIHSPLKVRSRGRPPTKRKQSKIEQIMKKSIAKARKKGVAGSEACSETTGVTGSEAFSKAVV
ncbi:hypothetical protein ZIOFF_028760 [Zingiber officinale]|uniref:Protein FAR1-RELATED SEQUENCE n=1 Tax=Zingiber officinale TaxID=94328 RepID=A0A8J5GVJ2_ZINOF|nr:hypothetical protein ZIOFF_028760 [Zingiber officinale]